MDGARNISFEDDLFPFFSSDREKERQPEGLLYRDEPETERELSFDYFDALSILEIRSVGREVIGGNGICELKEPEASYCNVCDAT
jgi:hypothetical protein